MIEKKNVFNTKKYHCKIKKKNELFVIWWEIKSVAPMIVWASISTRDSIYTAWLGAPWLLLTAFSSKEHLTLFDSFTSLFYCDFLFSLRGMPFDQFLDLHVKLRDPFFHEIIFYYFSSEIHDFFQILKSLGCSLHNHICYSYNIYLCNTLFKKKKNRSFWITTCL